VKNLFIAGVLTGSFVLLGAVAVQAQTSAPNTAATGAPAKPVDPARMRRQQQMTPEEAARDQQLQVLEARTGNTSFGAGSSGGGYREYDKRGGGFTIRKYKAMPGQENKRGLGHQAPGSITKGQPLVHNRSRKKKFLFF
jgi:hypothetical protein